MKLFVYPIDLNYTAEATSNNGVLWPGRACSGTLKASSAISSTCFLELMSVFSEQTAVVKQVDYYINDCLFIIKHIEYRSRYMRN